VAAEDKSSAKAAHASGNHGHDHGHGHGPCNHSHAPNASVTASDLAPADEIKAMESFVAKLWVLLASSLGFYLFSFQVHEKSILLPVMPAVVLLAVLSFLPEADPASGLSAWLWSFLVFAHMSLVQLSQKDRSELAFAASGVPFLFFTPYQFFGSSRKRHSWLRKLVLSILVLFLGEEVFALSFLQGHAKYPHLALMARLSMCCFVFIITLLVASYHSFVSSPVSEVSADAKKKE
jgi:alpha-1,3-glucosyltransferase